MATQHNSLSYLEKIVLASCIDAHNARVHNYHSNLILDVVLSGAVLYILTRQGKITIRDEDDEKSQHEQDKETHSSNANESLTIQTLIQKSKKKIEDKNFKVVDSSGSSTPIPDDENDDIIHEALALIKSAPEKPIQTWINEFSGRTVKGKYQIKDLKKRVLHGLVKDGLTTHEKHTIGTDKFPLTDDGLKQQEELFHLIQEIFDSYEKTLPKGKDKQEQNETPKLKFNTKDLVFVAFYLMTDYHLMAFPKDQRDRIKNGKKALFSVAGEVHRFLSMAENNTSHAEAEIITAIINLTYSSTTDSLT